MRILIVDDEKLTRDGLIANINWKALSFDQIDQADDGINAIQIALKHPPNVLLTDVRMPRMDGIELVDNILKLYPDCSVIFMSGYSDKEYLKAAIKFRAIRYVEKPIDPSEIMDALKQSIQTVLQHQAQQDSNVLYAKEAVSRFAQRLTHNGYDMKSDTLIDDAVLRGSINNSTIFTTCILRIISPYNVIVDRSNLSSYLENFDKQIAKWHLNEIHFIKNDSLIVLHIYGNERPEESVVSKIGTYIKSVIPIELNYFITFGKTVTGPSKVFDSYNSAAILLQSSFFFDYGSILIHKSSPQSVSSIYPHEFLNDFTEAIREKNFLRARELVETLYRSLKNNKTLLTNVIKDMYYKAFLQINSVQYDLKLQTENAVSDSESMLDNITNCIILNELHQMLLAKIDRFEEKLQSTPKETSTIFLIRDYISNHYGDYSLSIKDISDHVRLSFSYLCTVFKTETGETLNQYITNYRIEKAKQLLSDPRNKIIEVSSRVGYADNNYFGKIFKKIVGITPSEYREKELGRNTSFYVLKKK
ncbi:response regulator transcription factor [Lachnoclostridium phytofermentans]|uniref:Stage 0 sporulation protein A homolog n=1 Tax=Lachnoclostridium phytofermentans (strain ATCC 700394 / DSM 18823 / ISDg) TaxID=357809 RepID=A9KIW7_LACP7|nr:response regulator [Lachnoclostridium phytofermentans]ABX40966.1 two component transcriptional regulator, AraC family [Lachnoclostridium phytofermentans ISDg]